MIRSNILTVFTGAVAAFFYASLFLHLGIGQLLWPLAAAPLYLVAFTTFPKDSLLAVAGGGLLLTSLSVMGVLPAGSSLQIFLSFLFLIALPALCLGYFYTYAAAKNTPPKAEGGIYLLVALHLDIFSFAALFFALWGTPLHDIFYTSTLPLADAMVNYFTTLDLPEKNLKPEDIAHVLTRQMALFLPLLFIALHGSCFFIAIWLVRRFKNKGLPRPRLSPLQFSKWSSFVFFILFSVYTFMLNQGTHSAFLFYAGPFLMGSALPIGLQGASVLYQFVRKRLAKGARYGVYIFLLFAMVVAPIMIGFMLLMVGMINQAFANHKQPKQ